MTRPGSLGFSTARRSQRHWARSSTAARRDCFKRSSTDCATNPSIWSLTIGRDQDPVQFGAQPDNVHIERYIPQSLLFPYCDLVIAHSGFGPVAEALAHGLPLVTIPIDADQRHCRTLRCARCRRSHRTRPTTPDAIRSAVGTVLGDPSYRRNAEQIRHATAQLPGPEHAAALLERLAAEKQALLSSEHTG